MNIIDCLSFLIPFIIFIDIGGIYLDTDVIVLKSFDPLRRYTFTLGQEDDIKLGNGVIVSQPNDTFLEKWFNTYRTFRYNETWAYHDTEIPMKLYKMFPKYIHVEKTSINRPNWHRRELDIIYKRQYLWRGNYCIHLWFRFHKIQHNLTDIRKMKTTFGEIVRYVLFGSSELLD